MTSKERCQMRMRIRTATAGGLVLVLGLTACGGGSNNGGSTTTNSFNAALNQVFNPSDKKGGTVTYANSGDWDSLDPGETYYGYSWNFVRNYGRSLVMFKPVPGGGSNELVGDLATGLGKPSDDGKTWTY